MPDTELTNWKSGIDVIWGVGDGSDKGTAYCEEYLYHDKLINDRKVVYLRDDTPITMQANARNQGNYLRSQGGTITIGVNGLDGMPGTGDEGIIRYKIDRDRNTVKLWADNWARTRTADVLPAYTAPFTLASQSYEPGVPVVGTTGHNGGAENLTARYFRGTLDPFGDEWHTLQYAHDDNVFNRTNTPTPIDQEYYCTDGKSVLLVVNPKTPCFTARAGTGGQFHTTYPKAYFTPRVIAQTTVISGSVSIELRDIYGRAVSYRINGGSWVNAGGALATLTEANFTSGTNTLEYRSAGFEANAKTRTVIKNPTHPSLAETHGTALWANNTERDAVFNRVTVAPYSGNYNPIRTRYAESGHQQADQLLGQGLRDAGRCGTFALVNAFIALREGWNVVMANEPSGRSFGQFAKAMVLEHPRTQDPMGWEMSHSADGGPNKVLHDRGYVDSKPILHTIYAYDILVAHFRSDQVAGGITPVEDYYVRHAFAEFVYECMQWTMGMTRTGAPGMWGGAKFMAAVQIAMIMPEYSEPLFGTSGFGAAQTTYPLCPYPSLQLTWKQALLDGQTSTAYPGFIWNTPLRNEEGLFLAQGQVLGGITFREGDWGDKNSYLSFGLMGLNLQCYANAVVKRGFSLSTRFAKALERMAQAKIWGAKQPEAGLDSFVPVPLLMNTNFPDRVVDQLTVLKTLSGTDNNNPGKLLQDAGVFGYVWYNQNADVDLALPPQTVVPVISIHPYGLSRTSGQSASFFVSAGGSLPLTYQWKKNGVDIPGATAATYSIASAASTDSGTYSVVVTNAAGSTPSRSATLIVDGSAPVGTPPSIISNPSSLSVLVGAPASFSVAATGTTPFTYQWRKGTTPIPGATSATYTIPNAQLSDAGSFDCVVTNSLGSATSSAATLTVNAGAVAPTITVQPANQSISAGSGTSFSVTATGTAPLSYQWRKNGTNITGATSATYTIASAALGDAGSYSVVVTNSAGSATSNAATLTVTALPVEPTGVQAVKAWMLRRRQ